LLHRSVRPRGSQVSEANTEATTLHGCNSSDGSGFNQLLGRVESLESLPDFSPTGADAKAPQEAGHAKGEGRQQAEGEKQEAKGEAEQAKDAEAERDFKPPAPSAE
jgi:hypothetical protein